MVPLPENSRKEGHTPDARGVGAGHLTPPGRQARPRGTDSLAVSGLSGAPPALSPDPSFSLALLQAAERDNQNLEDKVRSLKTDMEESKYRQRHLKVELKSFLEVLDGKIDQPTPR